jgi:hypothetical protein
MGGFRWKSLDFRGSGQARPGRAFRAPLSRLEARRQLDRRGVSGSLFVVARLAVPAVSSLYSGV